MPTLTLRLPDPLDAQLNTEAALAHTSRSELARVALEKYLREQEYERRMAHMIEAARFLATNPEARTESQAIAEEFLPLDNEALDVAEGRKTGATAQDERGGDWWR